MPITKIDPRVLFDKWAEDIDPAKLGACLKEYIGEANHQGWDGFSSRDQAGIRRFVEDLQLYYRCCEASEGPAYFTDKLVEVEL
jgi:hypothetical protein